MGFSERGKQCLLPEEALYLLECVSRLPVLGFSWVTEGALEAEHLLRFRLKSVSMR